MLSKLALRSAAVTGPAIRLSVNNVSSASRLVRILPCSATLTTSSRDRGKNIYYGFSKRENQHYGNNRGFKVYAGFLVGSLFVIAFG